MVDPSVVFDPSIQTVWGGLRGTSLGERVHATTSLIGKIDRTNHSGQTQGMVAATKTAPPPTFIPVDSYPKHIPFPNMAPVYTNRAGQVIQTLGQGALVNISI